jgi:EAL domain-containing protein (putative c-di-GMP-specific phosphodiesterase class I)/GGDEF domain-containing protein
VPGVADELTGLPSVRAFAVALGRQAALARRYDRPGAVIVVSAERADDPGCRAVAGALRGRLRATDLLARIGGCEFAILLPEARATEAREVAGELVAVARRAAGVAVAAGIATFPDGLDRPAGALLGDADAALAAARGAVPPVAVFDTRVFRAPRASGSAAERLRRALAAGEVQFVREPVVWLHDGATDHHALAPRLPADGDGLLERAERFGLGRELDRRAVEHALAQTGDELLVSIGAGAATDRAFAAWLLDTLSADPGVGGRLVIGVPELAALHDLAAVRALAARLGEFGGRLALDDFGRLGALALLKALPVHHVRLDPALVRGLPGSDRDRAVVLALVHAAEALGAQPVATGVDGESELRAIRGFGISLAQGIAMPRLPS